MLWQCHIQTFLTFLNKVRLRMEPHSFTTPTYKHRQELPYMAGMPWPAYVVVLPLCRLWFWGSLNANNLQPLLSLKFLYAFWWCPQEEGGAFSKEILTDSCWCCQKIRTLRQVLSSRDQYNTQVGTQACKLWPRGKLISDTVTMPSCCLMNFGPLTPILQIKTGD